MTLAEIRPHLPLTVNAWVDGVLAGKPNGEIAAELNKSVDEVAGLARMFAEWVGVKPKAGQSLREVVLRMRIEELS